MLGQVHRNIPNLTAKPFQISKAYTEQIYQQTNSLRLEKTLKNWVKDGWDPPKNQSKLGYVIIVELLDYQVALPVLWIQTQHQLFSHHKYNIKQLIEFGPSPTLTGMASCTLKLNPAETSGPLLTLSAELACNTAPPFNMSIHAQDAAHPINNNLGETASNNPGTLFNNPFQTAPEDNNTHPAGTANPHPEESAPVNPLPQPTNNFNQYRGSTGPNNPQFQHPNAFNQYRDNIPEPSESSHLGLRQRIT
ncbi:hypothetical protein PTTG_07375, partial [Puccinia triticina 1-1 BBBD Race 1]